MGLPRAGRMFISLANRGIHAPRDSIVRVVMIFAAMRDWDRLKNGVRRAGSEWVKLRADSARIQMLM